jgi:hypothetical protein
VKRDADLAATFAQVLDELRHQYLFGFAPGTLDERAHKLEVRVTASGLRVKSRTSYLATAGK